MMTLVVYLLCTGFSSAESSPANAEEETASKVEEVKEVKKPAEVQEAEEAAKAKSDGAEGKGRGKAREC